MTTAEQEIERLTRERDVAVELAKEAMRMLPDDDLARLRGRLEGGNPDVTEHEPGPCLLSNEREPGD